MTNAVTKVSNAKLWELSTEAAAVLAIEGDAREAAKQEFTNKALNVWAQSEGYEDFSAAVVAGLNGEFPDMMEESRKFLAAVTAGL